MKLDDAAPAADVTPYVAAFYDLHGGDDTPIDVARHAEAAHLRFLLSAFATDYRLPDGDRQSAPAVHLIASPGDVVRLCADPRTAVFGIALTPAGWAATIGGDASLIAQRVIDAAMVFGTGIRAALGALRAAPDYPARAAIGEAVVRALVKTGAAGARGFVRQVDAWLTADPSPEINALASATGLSRRQVERKCKALYGVPPKVLARKYRALQAAAAIRAGDEALGTVIERGFYDQSHMIREIKQFTGLTPGQIRAEPAR